MHVGRRAGGTLCNASASSTTLQMKSIGEIDAPAVQSNLTSSKGYGSPSGIVPPDSATVVLSTVSLSLKKTRPL